MSDKSIPYSVRITLQTFARYRRQHAQDFRREADSWEDAGFPKTAELLRKMADATDELATTYELPLQ